MEFVEGSNPTIAKLMKPREAIVTAPEGTSSDEAYNIMLTQRVKKLPIVNSNDVLLGKIYSLMLLS
jgi:IMP dehydrogenase